MIDHERSTERIEPGTPLKLPDELLLNARKSIEGMMPGEIAFAKPGSVVIDNPTSRVLLDTADPLAPLLNRVALSEVHPALLRTFGDIGGMAVHGYIVDLRYILKPNLVFRSLDEDKNNRDIEDGPEWESLRTVNPLGVLFPDGNETHYQGELELQHIAKRFSECIDMYYEALGEGEDPVDCYAICIEYFNNRINVV